MSEKKKAINGNGPHTKDEVPLANVLVVFRTHALNAICRRNVQELHSAEVVTTHINTHTHTHAEKL